MQIRATPVISLVAIVLFGTQACAAEVRAHFYETFGYKRDAKWRIPFLVWTSEEAGTARRVLAKAGRRLLREAGNISPLSGQQKQIFNARVADMIADSRSGQVVTIVFDKDPETQLFQLLRPDKSMRTDRNGLLKGVLEIPEQSAARLIQAQDSKDGRLTFRTVSGSPKGSGSLRLIAPTGLSVISDIDDTIKVTQIAAGRATVIRNTFFLPFAAAPCMVDLLGTLASIAPVHYVSGGPWQLYRPLSKFMRNGSGATGFPAGSFHMKFVRTNLTELDSFQDLFKLLGGSKEATRSQKIEIIVKLIGDFFPQRQFILVGDSGELDPEVFAEVKKRFGTRIREIFIRDVVDARTRSPERLKGMMIILPTADGIGGCVFKQG